MNILLATQSTSLSFLVELGSVVQSMSSDSPAGKVGVVVSDRFAFEEWSGSKFNCDIVDSLDILTEWDVIFQAEKLSGFPQTSVNRKLDSKINKFIKNAIMCDRRFVYPLKASYTYCPPHALTEDDKKIAIIRYALTEVEKLFDRVDPKLVIGFICNSFLEYLVFYVAKKRKVKYANIRSLRWKNFVGIFPSVDNYLGTFNPLEKYSGKFKKMSDCDVVKQYEGAHQITNSPLYLPLKKTSWKQKIYKIFQVAKFLINRNRYDINFPNFFERFFYLRIVNPIRAWMNSWSVNYTDLAIVDEFCFFPLHAEPEVSLLVYGAPFTDQNNVIEKISKSLPPGMKLVLKDHPVMNGRRNASFYAKFLEIPNVYFLAPETPVSAIINKSAFIATISSSVAQEAFLAGKKTLILGKTMLDDFSADNGVFRPSEFGGIPEAIEALKDGSSPDEEVRKYFLTRLMEFGCPLNLYSEFLFRGGTKYENSSRNVQLRTFGKYILDKLALGSG